MTVFVFDVSEFSSKSCSELTVCTDMSSSSFVFVAVLVLVLVLVVASDDVECKVPPLLR